MKNKPLRARSVPFGSPPPCGEVASAQRERVGVDYTRYVFDDTLCTNNPPTRPPSPCGLRWATSPQGGGRIIPLTLALALNAASPSAAQTLPDFSGYWGKNSVDPGPPPEGYGPGPVMNKTRTFYMRIGDDENPILKPSAAEAVRRAGAISRTGTNFPTPSNQCWPMAPPNIWRSMGFMIVQKPDEVTLLYNVDQFFRKVRINGTHPANVEPSWYGDSIGHYEGDTLVIDTVGIKPGRYSMVDNYGSPQTETLHVVERIRLIDKDAALRAMAETERLSGRVEVEMGAASIDQNHNGPGLQVVFTVEDPAVFTAPWSAAVTYARALGGWEERVCAEGIHNFIDGKDADAPRADKIDF